MRGECLTSGAEGITNHCLNLRQKRRTAGAFHIQNVNAYHSLLRPMPN